jgi:hypothetical protein
VAGAGEKAQEFHRVGRGRIRAEVVGVDGTGAAMAGVKAGMVFWVDLGGGRLLEVQPLREEDAPRVRQHVARVLAEVGAGELRTDEHSVYEGIVRPPNRNTSRVGASRRGSIGCAWPTGRRARASGPMISSAKRWRRGVPWRQRRCWSC